MLDNILSQKQSLRQEQTISARQMQSLKLLTAPVQELRELVDQELAVNPVLEIAENPGELSISDALNTAEDTPPADDDEAYGSSDDWYDELPLPSDKTPHRHEWQTDLINSLAAEQDLAELLLEELRMSNCDAATMQTAGMIIESLDENGFLQTHPADIAMAANVSMEEVEKALKLVQSFDPPGIGARDLRECLLIQIERKGENNPLLTQLVMEHLEDAARNRLPYIAQKMKISMQELESLLARLRTLNPAPGGSFRHTPDEFISPEVSVEQDENGNYNIESSSVLPRIIIPDRYFAMLEDPALSADDKNYIRSKINAAKDLLRSLEQRDTTIRRIASLIVREQADFLRSGAEYLKPMTMRQAAEELNVHETTVSRAIAGKYLQTPAGLFPFRYFFSTGIAGSGGENISVRSVQERIRKLIAGEDPAKPLSDGKLSGLLAAEGINVARRTVAKYREELNIPRTDLRKHHS